MCVVSVAARLLNHGFCDKHRALNTNKKQQQKTQNRAEVQASTFEFTEATRAALNAALSSYVGTHNFHNYAAGVKAAEQQAKRYMLSFECPGTVDIAGAGTWVRLVVVGQSFMLHQIRKMVCVSVFVCVYLFVFICLCVCFVLFGWFFLCLAPHQHPLLL